MAPRRLERPLLDRLQRRLFKRPFARHHNFRLAHGAVFADQAFESDVPDDAGAPQLQRESRCHGVYWHRYFEVAVNGCDQRRRRVGFQGCQASWSIRAPREGDEQTGKYEFHVGVGNNLQREIFRAHMTRSRFFLRKNLNSDFPGPRRITQPIHLVHEPRVRKARRAELSALEYSSRGPSLQAEPNRVSLIHELPRAGTMSREIVRRHIISPTTNGALPQPDETGVSRKP